MSVVEKIVLGVIAFDLLALYVGWRFTGRRK